jgi:YhcG PDDEXK nuclease domain
VGQLNFYVQLVDDKLRNHTKDDPTLGILLVVDRDDVTVEVALRGITTPMGVTEWRRLPSEVRRALLTTEALTETVTRTVREIESACLRERPYLNPLSRPPRSIAIASSLRPRGTPARLSQALSLSAVVRQR